MSEIHAKIAQNSIIQLSGKLVSLVLGLVSVMIMTRYLGQEKFGYYYTVIAFLQFFGILVDFGLTLTTVQMISDSKWDLSKVMNSIMSFRVITATVFLGLSPIVVWFFPYNNFIKWGVLIVVFSFFCSTVIQALTGVFQQKFKMLQITVAEVVGRILLVGGVALTAFFHKDIYWIFGTISLSSILNLVLVFFFSRKYIHWKLEFDTKIWRELIHKSWPIALAISFNLIYLKMDSIILSLVRSQSEVGLYGATYRVLDILTMLPAVLLGIALPVLSKYFIDKEFTKLKDLLQKIFDALIIFAVPIIIGTQIIGRPVMEFFAGKDFSASGDILRVLILAAGAIFVTTVSGYAVVAVQKQRPMTWGYLVAAVTTLAGYLYFIPKFGYWGAAWMTVYSEILIMVWSTVLVYKTIKFVPSMNIFWRSIIPALIMSLTIYAFRDLHVLWMIFLAIIIYFPLLYLFRGIDPSHLRSLLRGR